MTGTVEYPDLTIPAIWNWGSNGEMIADVHELYPITGEVLDPTYGEGNFWTVYRPNMLLGCDLDPAKSPIGEPLDFTNLPFASDSFDCIVFDPPYKLNGRPDPILDARYGVDVYTPWQMRMALIRRGIRHMAPMLKPGGWFMLKCMDQVCSGAMRWQTDEFTVTARACGMRKVDRFDLIGFGRQQPKGRAQRTARDRGSTLLVFQKRDLGRMRGAN